MPAARSLGTSTFPAAEIVEAQYRAGSMPQHFADERKLDVIEQLVPLADKAGLPMTHLAIAFVLAHPGVTSAIIGPRTVPPARRTVLSSEIDAVGDGDRAACPGQVGDADRGVQDVDHREVREPAAGGGHVQAEVGSARDQQRVRAGGER